MSIEQRVFWLMVAVNATVLTWAVAVLAKHRLVDIMTNFGGTVV